jgi:hypothetical protein
MKSFSQLTNIFIEILPSLRLFLFYGALWVRDWFRVLFMGWHSRWLTQFWSTITLPNSFHMSVAKTFWVASLIQNTLAFNRNGWLLLLTYKGTSLLWSLDITILLVKISRNIRTRKKKKQGALFYFYKIILVKHVLIPTSYISPLVPLVLQCHK